MELLHMLARGEGFGKIAGQGVRKMKKLFTEKSWGDAQFIQDIGMENKGLEYSQVFIVGLNDGTLPHSRSLENPDAMQEERRLFYVGITRAKNRLFLVYSQTRSTFGYTEPVEPSRFLDDIPVGLLEEVQVGRPARRITASPTAVERWQAAGSGSAAVVQQRFHPGMRVRHPVFEDGMVLNSRLQDDDEIVDIFFENFGLKRVAASLAKLEIQPKSGVND